MKLLHGRGVVAALLAIFVASGCYSGGFLTGRSVTESTKPLAPGSYDVIGPVEGSCWQGVFYLIFIPIHFGYSDPAGHARDDALGDEDPAHRALVEATMDSSLLTIPAAPFLGATLSVTHVRGIAVKVKEPQPAKGVAPVSTTATPKKKK